jgi:uncharacterized delta-60 repeat protein
MMERIDADRGWERWNHATCNATKITRWRAAPGCGAWLLRGLLWIVLGWNWCCLTLPAQQPGSVDTSFQPGGGNNSGLDSDVFAIAVQGDGRIVVGGSFSKVGRTSRSGIARLHSDGSLDTSFDPGSGFNGLVESLVLLPDERLVLAGRFTMVNGQEQRYVARLLQDGKLDATFRPVLNEIAVSIAYGGENSVLVGGAFTTLDTLNRRYIARIRSDGTADHEFKPGLGPDKSVHSIARQADGRLILAGQFTSVQSTPRMRIARLHADGSLDAAFDPGAGPNHVVTTTSLQADGRVLLGGWFTNVAGATRTFLARLNADGSLDQSFTPGIALAWGGVMSVQADPAGGVIVGGEFEKIDGLSRVGIARLLENGALDVTFNPGSGVVNSDGWSPLVRSVMLQADGKVLIGGRFTSVNGTKLNRLARLHGHTGGTVELASSPQVMSESANADTIRLRRFGALDAAVSVNLEVTGVSASPAFVVQLPDHTVTFAAGESEQVVPIDFLHGGRLTGGDELQLALANPIGGILLGAPRTATVVVQNSSLPLVLEFTALERLNAEQVRLVLSAPTGTTCILERAAKPVGGAWTSLATNLASGNVCVFDVNSGVGNGQSFYRAFASTTVTP